MCGIAGIFDLKSRPVDEWRVKSMVESMAHRGPNGQGHILKCCCISHRRLSTHLTKAGNQPMVSPDKNYVITFNGEIYNWPEIRKKLKNKNWIFKLIQTILHAYIEQK